MFAWNLCPGTLSTPRVEQNQDHPSTVISVNFEHMAPCSSVSTVYFEHVFIF